MKKGKPELRKKVLKGARDPRTELLVWPDLGMLPNGSPFSFLCMVRSLKKRRP